MKKRKAADKYYTFSFLLLAGLMCYCIAMFFTGGLHAPVYWYHWTFVAVIFINLLISLSVSAYYDNKYKEPKKVYIVMNTNRMMLAGCFSSRQDAEIYTKDSDNFAIHEMGIAEYKKS